MIEGVKEGFNVVIGIIFYFVVMLVGIGIFNFLGVMDVLIDGICWIFLQVGLLSIEFVDVFLVGVMKLFSGGVVWGLFGEMIKIYGVDDFWIKIGVMM